MRGADRYDGPRIGDRVSLGGIVVELRAVAGVPGALVRVDARTAAVWVPLSALARLERRPDR